MNKIEDRDVRTLCIGRDTEIPSYVSDQVNKDVHHVRGIFVLRYEGMVIISLT